MKRRLFNILSALSLVLCITAALGWTRSHFAGESITCGPFHPSPTVVTGYGIASGNGVVGVQNYRYTFTGPANDVLSAASVFSGINLSINHNEMDPTHRAYVPYPSTWNRWGFFRYKHAGYATFPGSVTMTNELWFSGIPYWLPCLLTSPLAALCILSLWTRWQQNRRVHLGLCRTCGYDLRASKDRCPECGTPVIVTEAKA